MKVKKTYDFLRNRTIRSIIRSMTKMYQKRSPIDQKVIQNRQKHIKNIKKLTYKKDLFFSIIPTPPFLFFYKTMFFK